MRATYEIIFTEQRVVGDNILVRYCKRVDVGSAVRHGHLMPRTKVHVGSKESWPSSCCAHSSDARQKYIGIQPCRTASCRSSCCVRWGTNRKGEIVHSSTGPGNVVCGVIRTGVKLPASGNYFTFCLPCISLQILANNQLDALFHVFIYLMSLPVSSVTVLIIRRSNCVNTLSGTVSLCK
jgi:hypothetical protein